MASSNSDNTSNGAPDAQTPQASALPEILPNPEGGAAGISIAKVTGRTLINLRSEDTAKANWKPYSARPYLLSLTRLHLWVHAARFGLARMKPC